MNHSLCFFLFLIFLNGCTTSKMNKGSEMSNFFHVVHAQNDSSKKWLVMLPGSSGLTIFEDTRHYFMVAERMAVEGYSVLLVDYKLAYQASGRKVKESTGEKINWALEQALSWAPSQGMPANAELSIVGWSLAGEGLVLLANSNEQLDRLHIKSIALYYPSNQKKVNVDAKVPLLIMTGSQDQISTASWKKVFICLQRHSLAESLESIG